MRGFPINSRWLVLFGLFFSASSLPAKASPWGQDPGRVLLISTLSRYQSDGAADFQQIANQTYGEIGLGRQVTLIGNFIYVNQSSGRANDPFAAKGWSQRALGVQKQIFSSQKNHWAIKLGYAASAKVQRFGDGGTSQERGADEAIDIGLLWGRNFARDGKNYFTLENNFRKSLGHDADQLKIDASLGILLSPRWSLTAKSFNSVALTDPDPISPLRTGNDYDSFQAQLSVRYRLSRRNEIEVSILNEYAGRNIAEGSALSIGLWSRF